LIISTFFSKDKYTLLSLWEAIAIGITAQLQLNCSLTTWHIYMCSSVDSSIIMASQVVSSQSVEMLSKESFIRGYHAYMNIWTPVEDEILRLIPEPTNSVDRNAVAVMEEEQIVGQEFTESHAETTPLPTVLSLTYASA
jgi:hypothetical protein